MNAGPPLQARVDALLRRHAQVARRPESLDLAEALAAAIGEHDVDTRYSRAVEHRAAVERMSRDGTPVAQIAAALGLSRRHVVALRAQLGVGRRR